MSGVCCLKTATKVSQFKCLNTKYNLNTQSHILYTRLPSSLAAIFCCALWK